MIIALASLDSILHLLGVTVLFIFVLIITFFTTKLVGGMKVTKELGSNFKVIETYKITQNKFLQIVQIGERYIVISISKDTITFITELSPEEVMSPKTPKLDLNFSELLSKITKHQKDENKKDK